MKIKLQGMREQEAIEAKDLQIGDITIWNYGARERVIEKEFSRTKKTVVVKLNPLGSKGIFNRRFKATRLVGIDLNFNRMCNNCAKLRNGCSGERKDYYTACVLKKEKMNFKKELLEQLNKEKLHLGCYNIDEDKLTEKQKEEILKELKDSNYDSHDIFFKDIVIEVFLVGDEIDLEQSTKQEYRERYLQGGL